jgi:hypothetical protein
MKPIGSNSRDLILRSRALGRALALPSAAFRRMAASPYVADLLRDASAPPMLLWMRSRERADMIQTSETQYSAIARHARRCAGRSPRVCGHCSSLPPSASRFRRQTGSPATTQRAARGRSRVRTRPVLSSFHWSQIRSPTSRSIASPPPATGPCSHQAGAPRSRHRHRRLDRASSTRRGRHLSSPPPWRCLASSSARKVRAPSSGRGRRIPSSACGRATTSMDGW